MNLKKALVPLVLTASLALSACGNDSGMSGMSGMGSSDTASDSSSAAEEFNDADVMFAQMMIVHHRQAIEMAELASTRAASPEVKQLAADIEAAQDPEIQTMTEWLQAWGAEVPSDAMDGMEGMDHSSMSGMMTEADMQNLRQASGAEFDEMFLEMMVAHHQGAIEMAQSQQEEGQNVDAVALAEEIATAQTAELEKMQNLLGS